MEAALLPLRRIRNEAFYLGPHNHPDRSPNTLEKQRKRHRLHTTYTANLHKPIRVLATELGVPVRKPFQKSVHFTITIESRMDKDDDGGITMTLVTII